MYKYVILSLFILGACTKKEAPSSSKEPPSLYDQGKVAYMANCIACHNVSPKQAGSVGPDIYGSSLELVEAKVLRNEYPPGYSPKRPTKLMIAIPSLKDQIPAIKEFLNN